MHLPQPFTAHPDLRFLDFAKHKACTTCIHSVKCILCFMIFIFTDPTTCMSHRTPVVIRRVSTIDVGTVIPGDGHKVCATGSKAATSDLHPALKGTNCLG